MRKLLGVGKALILAAVASCVPVVMAGKPEEPVRERREETVARCLRDIQSPDVAVRRRASLLMGKYPSPAVDRALVKCLEDADAGIRLGALVSLTEERLLPPVAKMAVFRLLRDPDIHVRRQASSLLGDALGVSLRGGVQFRGNVHIRTGRMPQVGSAEWKEMRELMLAGLADEDGSVRKNVLLACSLLDVQVPSERLQAFLSAPDAELRLQALNLLSRSARDLQGLYEAIFPLADDPAAPVRVAVCGLSPLFGKDGERILRKSLTDKEGEVRVNAAMNLCRMGVADRLSVVRGVLLDDRIPGTLRSVLVYEVSQLPVTEAGAIYRELLEGSSPELAEAGMRMLNRSQSGIESPEFFISYLNSDKGRVADLAMTGIRLRMRSLKAANLMAMLETNHREARDFVLRQGVLMLDSAGRGELLAEACLHDDLQVRLKAIQQLGRYRPEGWEELLMASLEDSDPAIGLAAADGLCRRPSQASQKALKAYLPKCRDKVMRVRIEAALRRQVLR